MVSTPRKRRKQQSPVRNTQFERMLSASHSPEYSMDETSGIYPEESSGGFGGEVNGYGPRNVNMVHDSTVATLIGGRNIAEIGEAEARFICVAIFLICQICIYFFSFMPVSQYIF